MTIIQSSDLDFDTIKESLKTYLSRQTEFADYNFEGSGLSNILDVLAYNTHLNGLIANMAINESFLNSSQIRASVVSHAENLGYYPRSKTGSQATVNISIASTDTSTSTVTLPKFSQFISSVNETTYTFRTLDAFIAINDGTGNFVFKTESGSSSIPITEGVLKTKTFLVGETIDDQVYVIPDVNMDTSTVSVSVFDTPTSSSFTSYTNINEVLSISSNSTVYILREAPNGYYEFTFSDGNILGKKPEAGNKIVIEYLSSSGSDANLASSFEAVGTPLSGFSVTTTTEVNSAGGAEKESLDSIKKNAPVKFATQQRLVTAEDYKALILANYGNVVQDVSAWGGNDNIPPTYGEVYVSLNFKDGIPEATKTITKASIKENLSTNLAILSIGTEFSDPTNTFLEMTVTYNFDPDLTGSTTKSIENLIRTTVINFFANNLNTFDRVFRRSTILSEIDSLSPAILNSSMEVKMQQSFTPTLNTNNGYSVNFPSSIAIADDVNYIITSSPFTFNGQSAFIRNTLGTNTLEIATAEGTVFVLSDNIGSYDYVSGSVNITTLNVSAIVGSGIKISAIPSNQSTIRPIRNYILKPDESALSVVTRVDFQNTPSTVTL